MESLRQIEKRKMWELLNEPNLTNWSRIVLEEYLLSLYGITITKEVKNKNGKY